MTLTTSSKTWFITGASRGFGLEIARQALARGDTVAATARRPADVTAALGTHPNLLAASLDVTNEAQATEAVQAAIARFGRIDVLVNNAGFGLLGVIEESSAADVRAQFDTNVFGLLHVTRAVLPFLREQGSGHVVNLSSVAGYQSFPGFGVYSATKFAVEGLTEALAAELAPLGVFATVVEPGFFRTDFLDDRSLANTASRIGAYAATVGATRELAAGVNHRQAGDPVKLATQVLALADLPAPPLRLPLGSDTVQYVRAKNAFVEAEFAKWNAVAASTDHDDLATSR